MEPTCPYCHSTDQCQHLLLTVDLTFREAVNGALSVSFNKRWFADLEAGQQSRDFDESASFEEFLSDVECISDFDLSFEFEGGPGNSCTYRSFYSKEPNKGLTCFDRSLISQQPTSESEVGS